MTIVLKDSISLSISYCFSDYSISPTNLFSRKLMLYDS